MVPLREIPLEGGAKGIHHLSDCHNISFSIGIGNETNNYYELLALKLVLLLSLEKDISHLQIYGDSCWSYNG
jgi:ribonuclease HI